MRCIMFVMPVASHTLRRAHTHTQKGEAVGECRRRWERKVQAELGVERTRPSDYSEQRPNTTPFVLAGGGSQVVYCRSRSGTEK